MSASSHAQENIKRPNVSGQFYPSSPRQLSRQINDFLTNAKVDPLKEHIEVVIAPHAGYVFSGGVAAYAYKAASRGQYASIVVIAPSHFFGFSGISVWPEGKFQTPLGLVEVDKDFSRALINKHEQFGFMPEAFEREHSLEVHIPFLQTVFKDFKIVPIIMGQSSFELCEILAQALDEIIAERNDVLIVISTDMSHFHRADVAGVMDRTAIEYINNLKAKELYDGCQSRRIELCGSVPVTTALLYGQRRGLIARELKYADSGDVSGDKSSVVGYFSAVLHHQNVQDNPKSRKNQTDKTIPLSDAQKQRLIEIARTTIEEYVRTGVAPEFQESDARLNVEEGAFVTIHKNGQLRGCIGNVLGRGPLYQTVRNMAVAAATQDPRFPQVTVSELDDLEVEVSVLSRPWRIKDPNEVQVGTHGVIVSKGLFHQGLFLPQVATDQGWNREQFLSYLCAHKAGLPADAWKDPSVKLEVFTAQVFSEKDF